VRHNFFFRCRTTSARSAMAAFRARGVDEGICSTFVALSKGGFDAPSSEIGPGAAFGVRAHCKSRSNDARPRLRRFLLATIDFFAARDIALPLPASSLVTSCMMRRSNETQEPRIKIQIDMRLLLQGSVRSRNALPAMFCPRSLFVRTKRLSENHPIKFAPVSSWLVRRKPNGPVASAAKQSAKTAAILTHAVVRELCLASKNPGKNIMLNIDEKLKTHTVGALQLDNRSQVLVFRVQADAID
jgi:hypothetical protein